MVLRRGVVCVHVCENPSGRTCQGVGHQICQCARSPPCAIKFVYVCVCGGVCAHDRRGREKSWDGQLYHAYLKGHSVIVGLHFTEPGCGQREANWSWRGRGRLREIGLALKCCTGLKRMYKSWRRKEDESARSSNYFDLQQHCVIEIAFVTLLYLFGDSYFVLFRCICLLMSHLWKFSDSDLLPSIHV